MDEPLHELLSILLGAERLEFGMGVQEQTNKDARVDIFLVHIPDDVTETLGNGLVEVVLRRDQGTLVGLNRRMRELILGMLLRNWMEEFI